MDRWTREWSGDWNGRGEALIDALESARDTVPGLFLRFEGRLTWNLNGLSASYTDMAETKERLGYSAPPRWATLRLYTPPPPPPSPTDESIRLSVTPESELEVEVRISETQVAIAVAAENPFNGDSLFRAARDVIESRAVTKVPYYMRDTATPALSSRWTRSIVWIEKHPVLVTLWLGIATVLVAILAVIAGR